MQKQIILYGSETCPKCGIISTLLAEKHLHAEKIMDFSVMQTKGIFTIPVLEVDGQRMEFYDATQWIKSYLPTTGTVN